jgi:hypothetical protein
LPLGKFSHNNHVHSVRGHLSFSLLPLSSPTLHLFICIPPHHLCTIFKDHTHSRRLSGPIVDDSPCPHPLVPQQHRTGSGRIRTSPRDAMAPSAITWIAIFGRLGTRRLGTAFLCILL